MSLFSGLIERLFGLSHFNHLSLDCELRYSGNFDQYLIKVWSVHINDKFLRKELEEQMNCDEQQLVHLLVNIKTFQIKMQRFER